MPRLPRRPLPADEQVLAVLERKRALDCVWIATLALQLLAVALANGLGSAPRPAGPLVWSALLGGALFAASVDLGYRLRTVRALERSVRAHQAGGLVLLTWLWALSGGAVNPIGLAFFVPPLLAGALLLPPRLARADVAIALALLWGVALATLDGPLAGILGPGARAPGAAPVNAGALLAASCALVGLAIAGEQLTRALRRLQRTAAAGEDPGLLAAALRASPDPQLVISSDSFLIAHANDGFLRRMQLKPHRTLGRSLYNVVDFADRLRVESALSAESGEVPVQRLWVGPKLVTTNLRFHRFRHDGAAYTSLLFLDVTEHHYLRAAFDALDEIVLIVGQEAELVYANRAAMERFGRLYLGKPMLELLRRHGLTPGSLADAKSQRRVVVQDAPYQFSVATAKLGGTGEVCRVLRLSAFADQEALLDQNRHDPLTGAANRHEFERRLQRLLMDGESDAPLALTLWNLDGLKQINERQGPATGDALLAAFARIAGERLRPLDRLGRLDGDSFAVLQPGLDLFGAELCAQSVLDALAAQPVDLGGRWQRVAASAGLTLAVRYEPVARLIGRAEDALREAKRAGGAGYALREPGAG